MEKVITLNDLTKEELLSLIVNRGMRFSISNYDIMSVRYRTIIHKAKNMADEACIEMKTYHLPQNYTKWKEANDKFDRAMKLYDEAEKLINGKSPNKPRHAD